MKAKITKRVVDQTAPAERNIFVWDTEVPGFGLRVWPSGKQVFVFQYRNKHRQTRRPVIGQYDTVRPEQARRIARQWAAEVQRGDDPGGERREARKAPTIADVAERYMVEHARAKKKPQSVKSDETLFRLHILPALGTKKAAAVTRADVSKLHHAMRETPGAASSFRSSGAIERV